MCGIFGIIGQHNKNNVETCLNTIKHRGPDDWGTYTNPEQTVTLGLRRLSIIDLSVQGHQPMSNETGTIWIVFNGEIYNYSGIKSQLQPKHTFKSDTDTEVLIHGYEEWGIKGLLEKINGMFAFCICDNSKDVIYLARDRIGKKPLYYYKTDEYLAFSSETKAFFKLDNFNFKIDDEMFDLLMGFPYLPENKKTLLKNVCKVEPGTYIKTDSHLSVEKNTYWDLESHKQKSFNLSPENAKEQLKELLLNSVKIRLVADVPLGILLSGGLDSSLITAMAAKAGSNVTTINISFNNSQINESIYADIVAKHCKTNHIKLQVSTDNLYETFTKSIASFDDLSTFDIGLFSTSLLAGEAKKHGIKVVLVGEGADEIFGGYTWFQLSQYPFAIFPSQVRSWAYYYAIMRQLSPSMYSKYGNFLNCRLNEFSGSFFQKMQAYEIKYSLPNHYCMKVDKGSSFVSVEARAPYMDYRVVELATKLNKSMFLKNSLYMPRTPNEKYILREIARELLPAEIHTRKKRGGMFPSGEILDHGVKKDRELILSNQLLCDYWTENKLNSLINHTSDINIIKWQREWILWKCLIFSHWFSYYTSYAKV